MWDKKHDVNLIVRNDIPIDVGLYAWFSKVDEELIYIGKATGSGGLRRRIWSQHLNPLYLECRKNKFTSKDAFQVNNPVIHNDKIGIDKSAFRKSVARKYSLLAGNDSVQYLKKHYMIAFESYGDLSAIEIADLEKELIIKMKPKFNFSHNRIS
ncbi:hypothetical protein [Saccharibacillus sp. JS10]|uniref:hypothetical protein n=1 Tax=Saccharibacillus sp. JS10 TaxID=2950552 RepID=UPI00210A438E|nr:hypothetical protein [Saccharibacillus sp. JS10]MCQ4085870.1 hypothetical protein [Saccharibacillus sp. JS10]